MGIVLLVNTIYLPLFVYFGSQKALIFVLLLLAFGGISLSSTSDQSNGFPFDSGFTMVWGVAIVVGLLLLHGVSLLLTLHKYQTKDF